MTFTPCFLKREMAFMSFEKDLKWSLYYDQYGEFLTEKQKRMITLYYNDDYSLAEIAEELGISRQGVLDGLKRAQKKLHDMEEKLHLVQELEK